MKSFNYYKSKVYNQLKPYNKIILWIGIIGIVITLIGIFFGTEIINFVVKINSDNDNIFIENSSLTNSPIFQRSTNISLTYNPPPEDDVYTPFYSYTLSKTNEKPINGKNYNLYFMKIILPDNQEAFIPEVLFNKTLPIANCNEESTDCYIHHKFRIKEELKEEDICWIFTTRFGHDYMSSDSMEPATKFHNNPEECIKLVQD